MRRQHRIFLSVKKADIMLKTSDGRILMHPAENQIGMYVIKDRQKEHPGYDLTELQAMVEKQVAGEDRNGARVRFRNRWAGGPAAKSAEGIRGYQPAHLGDDFLIRKCSDRLCRDLRFR